MSTRTAKKVIKKKATKITLPKVTMTIKQAQMLQLFASKNNKAFKFLDSKLVALNA